MSRIGIGVEYENKSFEIVNQTLTIPENEIEAANIFENCNISVNSSECYMRFITAICIKFDKSFNQKVDKYITQRCNYVVGEKNVSAKPTSNYQNMNIT